MERTREALMIKDYYLSSGTVRFYAYATVPDGVYWLEKHVNGKEVSSEFFESDTEMLDKLENMTDTEAYNF